MVNVSFSVTSSNHIKNLKLQNQFIFFCLKFHWSLSQLNWQILYHENSSSPPPPEGGFNVLRCDGKKSMRQATQWICMRKGAQYEIELAARRKWQIEMEKAFFAQLFLINLIRYKLLSHSPGLNIFHHK